jgi:hypothetical protein
VRNLSSVGFSLEDGFGKQRDNSVTTGFGSSFQFDDVLKIAVFDREVCVTRMARLPSNFPAGALEKIDELALIFSFGFASLRHIVMAMVIVMAMIVKAMIVVMAKTIPRCRAICQKYNMLQTSRLADEFMERVNARNNTPGLYISDEETMASLIAKCREKTWPYLKNSTRQHYEFFMDKYLLPAWGTMRLRKMSTIEVQDFFNSFHPRLSPKSIRSMHGCLRAHLNQAKVWGMMDKNPAIGVKLPRKKVRKPTILLPLVAMGTLIECFPSPPRRSSC